MALSGRQPAHSGVFALRVRGRVRAPDKPERAHGVRIDNSLPYRPGVFILNTAVGSRFSSEKAVLALVAVFRSLLFPPVHFSASTTLTKKVPTILG